MSFTGDLEHLPIVDVIQLLSSSRKTGTLSIKSHKGESRLVFVDGYFVSANHPDNSTRIGKVLVDMSLISEGDLNQVLSERENRAQGRKALTAALIDQGVITVDDASKGLETLLAMTIVEVLTWSGGTFALDVSKCDISDEYRSVAEQAQQEISWNAQSVLMDALRMYDEMMRDGTLNDLFPSAGNGAEERVLEDGPDNRDITADLLGLDAIESLEKKIPEAFRVLKDHHPGDEHRQIIKKELQDIAAEEQERLFAYLNEHPRSASSETPDSAVILFSHDEFLSHAVTTVCNHEGFFVFATDDDVNLDVIIERSLMRDLRPVLIIDVQHSSIDENILALMHQKRAKYPRISVLLMVCSHRNYESTLQLLKSGGGAVFPRPCRQDPNEIFASGTIALLASLGSYLKTFFTTTDRRMETELQACFEQLTTVREPSETASILLRFVAATFERSLTFVVGRSELIAERGIGVTDHKSSGPSRPLMFKIPLEEPSVFRNVIENERLFYDQCNDPILTDYLFKEIGAPHSTKILLVPLKCNGKVIALTYADFGAKPVTLQRTDFVCILAKHAGLILDNAFQRKKV